MNYLKVGLNNVFTIKNKGLLTALTGLQLILVLSIVAVVLVNSINIMNNAQNVVNGSYTSYPTLLKSIYQLLALAGGIYIILQGLIWYLSHRILGKKIDLVKYIAVTGMGLGLISSLIYLFFGQLPFKWLLIISGVIYYFMAASLSLSHVKSWKKFGKAIWEVAILNFPRTILVFILNFTIIALASYLLYSTRNSVSFSILFLIALVLIISMTRLFLLTTLHEIHNSRY